jgi:O-antigen/teichoic acid export membrane protein
MVFRTQILRWTRDTLISVGGMRILSLIIPFICLPIILANVGANILGQFYLVFSIISILGFLDLGIPNALLNRMAQVQEDFGARREEEKIVYDSVRSLKLVGFITTIAISLLTWFLPLNNIFQISSEETQEFKLCVILSVISLFLKFLGNLGLKVLAFNDRYRTSQVLENMSMAMGYLIAVVLTYYQNSLLIVIISVISCPAIIVLGFTYKALFAIGHRRSSNNVKNRNKFLKLGKLNFLFIYLQFTTILMVQVDSLIVGSTLTTSQVSTLNFCWKFFSIPYLIIVSVYGYIWVDASKIKESSKALEFFKLVMHLTKKLFFVSLFFALVIFFAGQRIISVWTKGVVPTKLFCLAAGIWLCMLCVAYPITMMLNGMRISRYLIVTATLNMLVNVFASVMLTIQLNDPAGVLLGSAIGQIMGFFIPFYFFYVRHDGFKNRLKNVA